MRPCGAAELPGPWWQCLDPLALTNLGFFDETNNLNGLEFFKLVLHGLASTFDRHGDREEKRRR